VVEGDAGRKLMPIAYDVACTPASDDIALRLLTLEGQITVWITTHRPDVVAVERVFSQHNVRTVMGTAQAAAVAITTAARAGIPVVLHTPSEVKAAVTGSGRADKAQVGQMVSRLLGLGAVPKPADAADALALAICQVWRGSTVVRLEQLAATERTRLARSVAP
jgi:crossover junction endodeoxyribonuclease RuvC